MLEADAIARIDPRGMRDIIAALPDQLVAALKQGLGSDVELGEAQRVFLVGMGGSAIAGDVFAEWVANRSRVPIEVVRDYRLPSYARPEDVLVAVSYSGDTEETLAATTQGMKLGCRAVAITSGGQLRNLARKNRIPLFDVPTGLPPRGAFGHLFGILPSIGAEWVYGDLRGELVRAAGHLRELRRRLRPETGPRSNRAKTLAVSLRSRIPVVYGAAPFIPVAKRWQTQLNENAKVLAFSSSFPEADHNEIVGWCEDSRARRHAPILIRDRDESPAMRKQLDITVELMSRNANVQEVRDSGKTLLERLLGTLFLGDYLSLYLAALRRVDPFELAPIQELKAKLARSGRPRRG